MLLAAALAARTGLDAKRTAPRLAEMAARGPLASPTDAAFQPLLESLLVHETYFFRHPRQLELLDKLVLPQLERARQEAARPHLLLWSAGCATGEEAWTLALMAAAMPFRLLASDLSHSALRVARDGRYAARAGLDSFRGLHQTSLGAVLLGHSAWEAPAELRLRTLFVRHNLVSPAPTARQDLIVCRNVLIYFDAAGVAAALGHLAAALRPGGILLLGPADAAPPSALGLRPVHLGDAVAWEKPA